MIHQCCNCKFYKKRSILFNTIFGLSEYCVVPSNKRMEIDYDYTKIVYKQEPKDKNANKNCADFKPTLWYSFKRFANKNMEH